MKVVKIRRATSLLVLVSFFLQTVLPAPLFAQSFPQTALNQPAGLAGLPVPGTMLGLSPSYTPPIMAGLTIHPENPLQFDFIIDTGDDRLSGDVLQAESKKLINYFMASLTVPENEMWVNLSPYEKNRIIADGLSRTEMGRDMLAQDYLLKQLAASMLYPEGKTGAEFWKRVRAQAKDKLGTTEIPTDLFNKIWIVPQEASVYVHGNNVFVTGSRLKVMLEEDYLAFQKSQGHKVKRSQVKTFDHLTFDFLTLMRESILPEIEKEINEGKNFANLRQIYQSMILATWYKNKLRNSILDQAFLDKNKTGGIELADKVVKDKIYAQYLEALKKGVYNYIKEDYDPVSEENVPRKYFSGGLRGVDQAMLSERHPSAEWMRRQSRRNFAMVAVNADVMGGDLKAPNPAAARQDRAMMGATDRWDWKSVMIDQVDADFDQWAQSGQMAEGDFLLLKEILAGNEESLADLLRNYENKVSIKAEDKEIPERHGRAVYLKLDKPFSIAGRTVTVLRIKGARPRGAQDPSKVDSHWGRGFARNSVEADQEGNLYIKHVRQIVKADAPLGFIWAPRSMAPLGGMLKDRADMEFRLMKEGVSGKGFETDYPIATGVWKGRTYTGRRVGFVIAGMRGSDVRINIEGVVDIKSLLADVQVDVKTTIDMNAARKIYQDIGRSLRAYHDAGYFHRYPHNMNLGVETDAASQVHVILRDLDTTVLRSKTKGKNVSRIETAYRLLDLQRVVADLSAEGTSSTWAHLGTSQQIEQRIQPFIESLAVGYFGEMDQSAAEFVQLVSDMTSLDFGASIRELKSSDEKLVLGKDTPGLGNIWDHLHRLVLKNTASDRAMMFRPEMQDPEYFLDNEQGFTVSEFSAAQFLSQYAAHALRVGGVPVIILSAPSGAGKSTLARDAKNLLEKVGFKAEVFGLDMFMIDRQKRYEIINGIHNGTLDPKERNESIFFDQNRIRRELLDPVLSFKRSGHAQTVLEFKGVNIPEKKITGDMPPVAVTQDTVIIIEGKYAHIPELTGHYGENYFNVVLRRNPRVIRAQFLARERANRTPEQLAVLMDVYDRYFVPSYEAYLAAPPLGTRLMSVAADDAEAEDTEGYYRAARQRLDAPGLSRPDGDRAMTGDVKQTPGGIDFNSKALNLKEQGSSTIEFNFDSWEGIQPDQINGIVPVIINITPVPTLIPLLGLTETTEKQLSAL